MSTATKDSDAPGNPVSRGVGFVKESWVEVGKVHWPTWPETRTATLAVLGMIVFFALFLGLADMVLGRIVGAVLDSGI